MTKRLGAILLALALVLTMGLTPAVAAADNDNECVRYGQGYWKQWLADDGNQVDDYLPGHTNKHLLDMLNTPARGGNADVILSYQFIAAALNAAVEECDMPVGVQEAFDAANAHLHGCEVSEDRSEILGWKDILEFWNENKYAELLSVVYEGTCTRFGSHAAETLTLTFSNDVFRASDVYQSVRVWFSEGGSMTEDPAVVTWSVEANTVTLTSQRTFNNPRPEIGHYVTALQDIVDFIGNPVVVPDGGVEVEAMTYHYHWEPGLPYGATEDVPAVAIVRTCGMEVWWYSDGTLISEGWYHDMYSVTEMSGWNSGNPADWNAPVKYLFGVHFPEVTFAWWTRATISVDDVPAPAQGSMLLP